MLAPPPRRPHLLLVASLGAFASVMSACDKPRIGSGTTSSDPAPTSTPAAATTAAAATAAATTAGGKQASPKKLFQTRGTIKGIGDSRKSVKIAHEDIAGGPKAGTASFGVMAPYVIEGLKDGDAVEFSYTEEFDGRILIQTINKR